MKPEKELRYPVLDVIRTRWSGRAYSDKKIEKDHLLQLMEAARWAPSSYNEQPWRFIIAEKGSESFDKLLSTLLPGNASWASNSSALILTVVKKSFTGNGSENRYAWHDLGAAVGFLSLQAEQLDINVHQMAGFKKASAEELFEIPDSYETVSVVALGYRGNAEQLPEELKKKEYGKQDRKALEDIIFFDKHNLK